MGILFFLAIVGLCFAAWVFLTKKKRKGHNDDEKKPKKKKKKKRVDVTRQFQGKRKKKPTISDHERLVVTMRGHIAAVNSVSLSPCGKFLATCSDDRTIRVWRDFLESKNPPYSRQNWDSPVSCCCFSDDGNYVLVYLEDSQEVLFLRFKVKKGIPTLKTEFKFVAEHDEPVTSICMPSDNRMITTCSRGRDTDVKLWTPKGKLLHVIKTRSIVNHMAAVSDDGRYISVATRMSGMKVYRVDYHKQTQTFVGVTHVFDLKGHKRAVNCIKFGAGSEMAVTASSDGSWCLWNLNVQIHLEEQPQALIKRQAPDEREYKLCDISVESNVIAVSDDQQCLTFHHLKSGKELEKIELAVTVGNELTDLCFSPDGDFLITAGSDKAVRVWKTPSSSGS